MIWLKEDIGSKLAKIGEFMFMDVGEDTELERDGKVITMDHQRLGHPSIPIV